MMSAIPLFGPSFLSTSLLSCSICIDTIWKRLPGGYHEPAITRLFRTSAFAGPFLQGLGCLSAASCRGHRATYIRAACLAQLAAKPVGWYAGYSYRLCPRLVVPHADGRGERRSCSPRIMGYR